MKKSLILSFVMAAALGASAQAGVPSPVSAGILGRLDKILDRAVYTGLTRTGRPCEVRVMKQWGYGGQPVATLNIQGFDPMPGVSGPFPIMRNSGSFQASIYEPEFTLQILEETERSMTIRSTLDTSRIGTNPVLLLGEWEGVLKLQANAQGAITSIAMTERSMDPGTGFGGTRSFYCGR